MKNWIFKSEIDEFMAELTGDPTVTCYDRHAQAYDIYQSKVVPGYLELLDLVARACQRFLPPKPRIIDLGCGTGNASLAILKRIPARIYLIDGSERMTAFAAEKITRANPDAIMGALVADISRDDWDQGQGEGAYEAIVSTLVLEHLPFDRYKRTVEKCFRLLAPGGWLIAAEGYINEGIDMQEWFIQEMEARRMRIDPDISDSISRLRDEMENHYFASKEEKKIWWEEAGFCSVTVIWQHLCIALMAGKKPV